MKRIRITKRTHDYHACLADRPAIWGVGETVSAAIGDLIYSHPETFGVEVILPVEFQP